MRVPGPSVNVATAPLSPACKHLRLDPRLGRAVFGEPVPDLSQTTRQESVIRVRWIFHGDHPADGCRP